MTGVQTIKVEKDSENEIKWLNIEVIRHLVKMDIITGALLIILPDSHHSSK